MAEGSSGHHPGGNRRPHRTGHHQLHNLSFQPMIEESFPLFTADEEVASERELLKSVEDGPYMQEVKYIIIHCSATRENRDFTVEDLLRCHRQRKFRTIGYHFYIRRSGIITQHRKLKEVGAHCRPGTVAPSAFAMRVVWMRKATRPTRARRNNVSSCCCC